MFCVSQVRTYGVWYTYCAKFWSEDASATVCRAMGYSGVVSWYKMGVQQVGSFLILLGNLI